jgi:hypothetical protein
MAKQLLLGGAAPYEGGGESEPPEEMSEGEGEGEGEPSENGEPSEEEQNAAMDLQAAMVAKAPDKMEIASALKRFIDLCYPDMGGEPAVEVEVEPPAPVGNAPLGG